MSDNVNRDGTAGPGDSAAGDRIDWDAIRDLPGYRELTRARRRVVLPAAVVYLAGYFGFLLLAGLAPGALGHGVHGGLTVGFVLMAAVFVLVWLVALVYVKVSNGRLDRRADDVSDQARALVAAHARDTAR
jgi:uncharacterized membrane protein (DUF485 family)